MAGRAIDFEKTQSLVAMFFEQADHFGDRPFLWSKQDGAWTSLSWADCAETVIALANGLLGLDLRSGDRVVILSENRPEWCLADLAVMAAGAITVPAYTTNTVSDHLHILNDCQAAAVIVSTGKLARKLMQAAAQMGNPPMVIVIDPTDLRQNPGLDTHLWADVLESGRGQPKPQAALRARRGHSACIIYTSGTGGAPKGVVLSHGSIIANCMGAYDLIMQIGLSGEVFLSFLPLSHAYEHTAGQFFPISLGAQIYYAEGLEQLAANLQEVRPTLMTAVPRLYEVLRQKILRGVERQGGAKLKWFNRAVVLGVRRQVAPDSLTMKDRLLDLVCTLLVRRKVGKRFGGRLKCFVSGGAPLNVEVGQFFTALGVRILQGYGQTEAAPVISANSPIKIKMDTVGPPLRGVTVKIAEDGEICVRGELVMRGYWNNPKATDQVIDGDGWLHTGDIGEIDEDGYLKITDRKKDIIVNSGGDNIAPQRVEGFLALEPEIAQAMVYGDKRPHLVALLVPDPDFIQQWAKANDRPADLAALADDTDFHKAVGAAVQRVNRNLSNIEKVRRFAIADEAFSVDNAMMTPTLKIRRHVIREKHGDQLEALYE